MSESLDKTTKNKKMTSFLEYEFNYANLLIEPFKGDIGLSSERLLRNIISKINAPDFPSRLRIINRHGNRTNTFPRNLVHISARITDKGSRCYGQMALIKNKAPMLWNNDDDMVEEIQKDENKKFIEMTNYVIHFGTSTPIIMVEFNSAGPRLSDIEFYLRQISKEYKIARAMKTVFHLDLEYSELESKISNIFDIQVKVDSKKRFQTGNDAEWYKPFKKLQEDTGYKEVKMELFFGRKKDNGNFIKNIQGLKLGRGIINWLKKDTNNIDYIEDLKMTYEINNNGDAIDLDFLKNKTTSIVQIESSDGSTIKKTDLIDSVGKEFNYYLESGKTHRESKITK